VIIKPLFAALAFLHGQNFIHRDVKVETTHLFLLCSTRLLSTRAILSAVFVAACSLDCPSSLSAFAPATPCTRLAPPFTSSLCLFLWSSVHIHALPLTARACLSLTHAAREHHHGHQQPGQAV
jgi:serine/threonine protein kinase